MRIFSQVVYKKDVLKLFTNYLKFWDLFFGRKSYQGRRAAVTGPDLTGGGGGGHSDPERVLEV